MKHITIFSESNQSSDTSKWKQPPEVFCKKSCFRNFAKFTGKHQCQCLLYNKVAIKKETLAQVNFAKFLRAPVFYSCGGCFCQKASRLSILITSINHCIWNTEAMVAETNYEVVKFCNLTIHIGPQQNIRSVTDLLWSIIFTPLCCYKLEYNRVCYKKATFASHLLFYPLNLIFKWIVIGKSFKPS